GGRDPGSAERRRGLEGPGAHRLGPHARQLRLGVDTRSTPMLLRMMAAGRLPSSSLITHRFELGQMEEAYEVFSRAGETGALKVVLGGPQHTVVSTSAQV
ncbi:alcohol dehydrogenase, partial [Streptomyces xanthochromogenes]